MKTLLKTSFRRIKNFFRASRIDSPPAFIVGCGHSGTSLLLAILGAHSRLYAIPQESGVGFLPDPEPMLRRFDRMTLRHGKSRWIEKTPKHIRCIERLLQLRPEAKVLLILRDGRDVACSIQERNGSLSVGIKRWIEDNDAGQAFWTHPKVHVLKYESIIEDFEATIESALGFLNEDFDPSCREYFKTPKYYYSKEVTKPENSFGENHDQYRNWQINQPLFDGRGKWKRMTDEEKRLVKDLAGPMLVQYGYTKDDTW